MIKSRKTSNGSSVPNRIYVGNTDPDSFKDFDLIQIQKDSWQKFLDKEIKSILQEFFPIEDYTKKNFLLELICLFRYVYFVRVDTLQVVIISY